MQRGFSFTTVAVVATLIAVAAEAQWQQIDKEKSPASDSRDFGWSVAIEGDWALVGDPSEAFDRGAAYVFQRGAAGDWSLVQTLLPPSGTSGSQFGWSVDLSVTAVGCRGIVGANFDNQFRGSAFIYECGNWGSPQRIVASDANIADAFGYSVSISGNRALVGANGNDGGGVSNAGAAYAFERNGSGTWVEVQKLLAGDPEPAANFGHSVSIAGSRAAIGATSVDAPGQANAGAAYVYDLLGSSWVQQAKLVADDPGSNDNFGWAIAVSGNSVLVGAIGEDDLGSNSGAVYAFRNGAAGWEQEEKLKAFDAEAGDQFGASVHVRSGWGVIGAPSEDEGGWSAGAIYVSERDACGDWHPRDKIVAHDALPNASLGFSAQAGLRAAGGFEYRVYLTVLGGAFGDGGNGSAYWFEGEIPGTSHGCVPKEPFKPPPDN